MAQVFILGSGFSKAINAEMPLLWELTSGVQSALEARGIEVGSDLAALGDVESWLTTLADPAPWQSYSEQIRNSALFADVSQAIYDVLAAAQERAAAQPPPHWLVPLVRYWHRTQATVITFNYDCLIELTFSPNPVVMPSDLYVIPVTPAVLRRTSPYGHERQSSLNLLKLHGSLSWWYSGPGAEQSDAIYEMLWTGGFGKGMTPAWSEVGGDFLVEDKFPMIVPPAATKSSFYKNRLLATQWIHAAKALQQADELVIMGYSVPATDLTVNALIATQFKGDKIMPVNPDAKILKRASKLGDRRHPPHVIDTFVGNQAVMETWTARHVGEC